MEKQCAVRQARHIYTQEKSYNIMQLSDESLLVSTSRFLLSYNPYSYRLIRRIKRIQERPLAIRLTNGLLIGITEQPYNLGVMHVLNISRGFV